MADFTISNVNLLDVELIRGRKRFNFDNFANSNVELTNVGHIRRGSSLGLGRLLLLLLLLLLFLGLGIPLALLLGSSSLALRLLLLILLVFALNLILFSRGLCSFLQLCL